MAKYDDDDPGFMGQDEAGDGDRITGALLMLAGGAIFLATVGIMFYETELSFGHGLGAFQEKFVLIVLFGVPVFSVGIWIYKWGKRVWRGQGQV